MAENPTPNSPQPASGEAPGEASPAGPSVEAGGLQGKLKGFLRSGASSKPGEGLGEIVRSMGHKDSPTRMGSFIYIFSIVGIVVTSVLSVRAIFGILSDPDLMKGTETDQGANLNKFFREQKEKSFSQDVTLLLGTFRFEARLPEGAAERKGALNVAEIEITVECETIPTCRFLEVNGPKARDQVFAHITAIDQSELISSEGKRRVKETIRARLNEWLQSQGQGRIRRIYFTKLFIS